MAHPLPRLFALTVAGLALWLSPAAAQDGTDVGHARTDQRTDQGEVARQGVAGDDAPRPIIRQADENEVRRQVTEAAGTMLQGKEERIDYVTSIRMLDPSLPPQQDTGTLGNPLAWMPQAAAAQADEVDFMFRFVLWVSIFFTVLIVVLMAWFAFIYRARSDDEPDPVKTPSHSTTLEITWTVIPTCIVLVMFALGFRSYLNDTIAPPNALKVNVVAGSWYWNFEYPNGAVLNHLHLPKGRPVEFVLKSADVIHSIYIPAFRMKKDVVPGRFNRTWTTPTVVGEYELFCTEYCGVLHSRMGAKVFVHEPEVFEDVFARVSDIYTDFATGEPNDPATVGRTLASSRGCIGCHSIDGSAGTGPTWRDLYGRPNHVMADGEVVVVDDDYIRESIYYPGRRIVQGYGNVMASYLGVLSERDVASITAYMRTISQYASEGRETDPAPVLGRGEEVDPRAREMTVD